MIKELSPTCMFESLEKIPFDVLEKYNIKGIMLDVDNTLTDHENIMTKEKLDWLEEARKRGIRMCILSNTYNQKKVRKLMQELDINGINLAMKPMLKGFVFALDLLALKKEEVCMIGDQIFTDILGANRFGIMSILVKPFDKSEALWVKIKRPLEKIIIKRHEKHQNKKQKVKGRK